MFLTLKEVMERYKASKSSVYRWASDPEDPFPQSGVVGGRCKRWLITDLEAYDRIVLAKGKRSTGYNPRSSAGR